MWKLRCSIESEGVPSLGAYPLALAPVENRVAELAGLAPVRFVPDQEPWPDTGDRVVPANAVVKRVESRADNSGAAIHVWQRQS